MPALTQGEIQIESAVPVADIQDLHMEVKENAHIYVRIEGMVSDEERQIAIHFFPILQIF